MGLTVNRLCPGAGLVGPSGPTYCGLLVSCEILVVALLLLFEAAPFRLEAVPLRFAESRSLSEIDFCARRINNLQTIRKWRITVSY